MNEKQIRDLYNIPRYIYFVAYIDEDHCVDEQIEMEEPFETIEYRAIVDCKERNRVFNTPKYKVIKFEFKEIRN